MLKNPPAAAARLWSGARNPVPAWCPCLGMGPGPGAAGVFQRTLLKRPGRLLNGLLQQAISPEADLRHL